MMKNTKRANNYPPHRGFGHWHSVVIVLLVALSLLPFAAHAQEAVATREVTADEVNTIASKMYCPVCESIPLDVCPTAACAQWRDEIRIQLSEGQSEQQVIDNFVDRYGDRVVGTPQDPTLRALSLVTPWLIAAALLLGGGWVLWRWRNGHATSAAPVAAAPTTTVDDLRARLEADVRARR